MIRTLHLTGGMDRGGVETWLMHVLRNVDPSEIRMDFFSHTSAQAAYDDEIESSGARIFRHPAPARRPLEYARHLHRVLTEEGPYDVVHSHVHLFSGWVLRIAARAEVPVRIAHSHVAQGRHTEGRTQPWRPLYRRGMRWSIDRYATAGLANSVASAEDLFGPSWATDPRNRILPYGFDFGPYATLPDKSTLKKNLGLSAETKVVGHVGRFHKQKNHPFLVEVFERVRRARGDAHLLLVGGRGNVDEIRADLKRRGLNAASTITGEQQEVAAHIGAMDLMVFPSLYEGLGIVVLEAQAAGVRTLASEGVPVEADVVPGMVKRLSLAEGADAWATAVLRALDDPPPPDDYATALARSVYGIERCISELRDAYRRPPANAD